MSSIIAAGSVTLGSSATCPACGALLVIEGLGPDQAVLCPACCARSVIRRRGFVVRTSRLAIVSLTLGIGSLLGIFVTGIPAIIVGVVALRKINRSQGSLVGRSLAIAGIATGAVFGFMCAPFTLALMLPLVQVITR